MKFEHILQVYWSKGLFFSGKLIYTNKLKYHKLTKNNLYGLGPKFNNLLLKRLEFTTFLKYYTQIYYVIDYCNLFHKKIIKTMNIVFSQINNVNLNLIELKRLNILRKYLIKSYKGYCHAIGKPVRGQRTWSNS
jgi:ribosomal protein S13